MTISAVLLVGGESRRMGQDKATLTWNGRPLWQKQVEVLRQLGADELLISGRTDPEWRPTDMIFVPDVAPSCGPHQRNCGRSGKNNDDTPGCAGHRYAVHELRISTGSFFES